MKAIDRITSTVTVLGGLLSAGSFVISNEVGFGALAGALVAIADWLIIRWIGQRMLAVGDRARTVLSLVLIGKMGLVFAACAVILSSGLVSPVGFMIGIGALVLGVLGGAVREMLAAPAADADASADSLTGSQ